jgi:hypothetical protein
MTFCILLTAIHSSKIQPPENPPTHLPTHQVILLLLVAVRAVFSLLIFISFAKNTIKKY